MTVEHWWMPFLLSFATLAAPMGGWTQSEATKGRIPVPTLSTAGDEVVIGSDGKHAVLLRHPGRAPLDWSGAITFIADTDGSPHKFARAEPWGKAPVVHRAWESLGDIVHVDIDPLHDLAVISAHDGRRFRVWLSARDRGNAGGEEQWSEPWAVPALEGFQGDASFAMFDPQEVAEGDILLSLRPAPNAMEGWGSRGHWKGGLDVARILRRGGYRELHWLDEFNSEHNEWALTPHPVCGAWLSTDAGGGKDVNIEWCPQLPASDGSDTATLDGQSLRVTCSGRPVPGMVWSALSGEDGVPLARRMTDDSGLISLTGLTAQRSLTWKGERNFPRECDRGLVEWLDENGRVIQRFVMRDDGWSLTLLAALRIEGWDVMAVDASSLPGATQAAGLGEAPAWVVFHPLGTAGMTDGDLVRLKTLAQHVRQHPEDLIRVVGHASADGDADGNVALAMERARQVAVRLEFAGLPSSQIRFEGRGSGSPLLECPPGVQCPTGPLARSRRTELHLEIGKRP